MKTKTAMQELIERLKSLKSKGYDDAGIRTDIEIATQLLAKEKQDIIDAYENGYTDGYRYNGNNGENYFTQKYEQ